MLIEHPLLENIRKIQEQGRTGSLPLEKGSRTIILCFRDGLMEAAGSDIQSFAWEPSCPKKAS